MILSLVWILLLVFCDESKEVSEKFVTIKTTTGAIKGKVEKVVTKHDVMAFLGIPFAEPPIKNNRFKNPIAIKPWEGVLDATRKSASCMQITNKNFGWNVKENLNEDCLYLNVWVPKKFCISDSFNTTNYQLPIMVWIHGGGFAAGSSVQDMYDGATLAAYTNVIVASMNYRVGSFGFLYSGTVDSPGNMGLQDQLLALKWIKSNAKSFCGDPNKITLFGESAGAIAIGLHLISPLSRNSFDRVILESGSPYHNIIALDSNLVKLKGSQFATAFGCANETINLITDPKNVISCLRNLPADDITKVEAVSLENVPYLFLPTSGNDFLPITPFEAFNTKDFKQTEVLIGTNLDEGAIFLNYAMPDLFTEKYVPDLSLTQARSVVETLFIQSVKPTAKEVADFYLGNLTNENPKAILKAVHDAFGDNLFVCPSVFLADHISKENDVFYYLFTHKPNNTNWGDWIRVGHFEEINFVFGAPMTSKSYTNEECKFSYDIMRMWATFAQHGRPTLSDEEWPPYSNSKEYKILDPNVQNFGKNLHSKACNFWKDYLK